MPPARNDNKIDISWHHKGAKRVSGFVNAKSFKQNHMCVSQNVEALLTNIIGNELNVWKQKQKIKNNDFIFYESGVAATVVSTVVEAILFDFEENKWKELANWFLCSSLKQTKSKRKILWREGNQKISIERKTLNPTRFIAFLFISTALKWKIKRRRRRRNNHVRGKM